MGVAMKVMVEEKEITVLPHQTLLDVKNQMNLESKGDIVLAYMNGRLCELTKEVEEDAKIEFIGTDTNTGNLTYRRSATLLMLKAFYDVFDKNLDIQIRVMYSISKGYYCEVLDKKITLTKDVLAKVKARMDELVALDIPIEKEILGTDEAISVFAKNKMFDKENLFKYRRVSKANIYKIEDYQDYYYGYMVPSTGYIKYYELYLYEGGFVLQMPTKEEPKVIPEFKPQRKLFSVLKQSENWSKMLEVDTVGALNDAIANGKFNDLILVQEALQEKKIAEIAEDICKTKKRIVLIAGPSSSGKTSFSHRLSIQLRVLGRNPHPIAVDNYFLDREKTPLDEFGKINYEDIEAIDLEKFNYDMLDLLAGKTVQMPTFNFVTGKQEYKGDFLKIGAEDILVIEGIHGLNNRLTEKLTNDSKYRIYISALTQLNVDEHNRIPTTDGRLIRRMVRDARTRGTTARKTINMWESVRRGEERYIFPFQENADAMFNSALIYELCILKQYAEPILFSIPKDCEEYFEAKRILKFLDYFLGTSSDLIPNNSILREFIGGSCFRV